MKIDKTRRDGGPESTTMQLVMDVNTTGEVPALVVYEVMAVAIHAYTETDPLHAIESYAIDPEQGGGDPSVALSFSGPDTTTYLDSFRSYLGTEFAKAVMIREFEAAERIHSVRKELLTVGSAASAAEQHQVLLEKCLLADRQGMPEEAMTAALEALDVAARVSDQGKTLLQAQYNAAFMLQKAGRHVAADSLYTIVVERRRLDEPTHDLAAAIYQQGRNLEKAGDLVRAESVMREAIRIAEELPPNPTVPSAGYMLSGLASVVAAQGREGDARALHEDAISRIREQIGSAEREPSGGGLPGMSELESLQGQLGKVISRQATFEVEMGNCGRARALVDEARQAYDRSSIADKVEPSLTEILEGCDGLTDE